MKGLKTKKFWFLVLNISICLNFSCFTLVSLPTFSKSYAENFSEKNTENDEKPIEQYNSFYINELAFELSEIQYNCLAEVSMPVVFKLPQQWLAPATPPPNWLAVNASYS